MRDPDPLVTTRQSQVKRRSIFSIIGIAVVLFIAMVVIYFAWIGWRAKGKPVPEVDVTTRPATIVWPVGVRTLLN
jgi:hypothetical protein